MHQLAIAAAACFLALNLTAAPGLTQEAAPSAADAMLVVGGDVAQPLTLKPADLKSMPRTKVTVSEAGKDTPYEGVLVGELLKRAGAPVGRDLSGKAVATYVRATAKDGYQVVFSLAELDPGSPRTTSSSPTRSTASRCSTIDVITVRLKPGTADAGRHSADDGRAEAGRRP